MNIDITEIVVAIIGLLSVIVTSVVVPLLRKKYGAEVTAEIQQWIEIAVHAAEQIFRESGMGAQKKQYVIDFLKERGIDVDDKAIENAIEAAVYDMNNALADIIIQTDEDTELKVIGT